MAIGSPSTVYLLYPSIRSPCRRTPLNPSGELQDLLRKGAVEPAPQSPGFYSRLFLVQKASGSWRPIIDLSTLNNYITSAHFHMETPRSVLNSIRPGDWMISLDLQDAYLQVPVHHDSRRFLRFVVAGKTYQFRVLCFCLTTAPQVFTMIMAPVSAILHRLGVRMLRYLDDWLILASTEIACIQSRDRLLAVCKELGTQVNFKKSSLVPTQSLVYLGMEIQSLPFIARPTPARANNLVRLIEEFLSTPSPPAVSIFLFLILSLSLPLTLVLFATHSLFFPQSVYDRLLHNSHGYLLHLIHLPSQSHQHHV